jgi:lactoylglutathione lyase
MLRVTNLERSVAFYTKQMGMTLLRREEYPEGRFTLAFVGYGEEHAYPALELTHNWDRQDYDKGSAYGHVALEVDDVFAHCARLESQGVRIVRAPGPTISTCPQRSAPELIAFIEDPDGYRIELIQR